MNRSTYLIFSLSSVLATSVLLAIAFNPPVTPRATAAAAPAAYTAQPATLAALPLEPGCHDPVLIKEGPWYYVFYTGGFVNCIRSKDLIHWENPTATALAATSPLTPPATPATAPATTAGRGGRGGRGGTGRGPAGGGGIRPANAFPGMPNSISATVNARDLWAPDIAFYNGKYMLYYAASSFGSRNSAIGLATNKTLDPASPNYQWHDEGVIIRTQNSDNYNAIDANFVLDEKGQPWLDFGSFWSGIKLRKLTPDGKPDPADPTLYAIAARTPPETAIEAPFIIREGRWFYLFVSWDRCCQGLRSTYRIMVGRSEKITGPYLDQAGKDMAQGGGTQLLAGDGKRLIGPGHEGLFKDGDHWLMVHHFYDGNTPNGTGRLQVRPVSFDNQQWPVLGKPNNSPN
jgi:arabinan endo-1,5-alpha-L-arabinosidase